MIVLSNEDRSFWSAEHRHVLAADHRSGRRLVPIASSASLADPCSATSRGSSPVPPNPRPDRRPPSCARHSTPRSRPPRCATRARSPRRSHAGALLPRTRTYTVALVSSAALESRAPILFRAGGPVRSDFASRSQARICSGSSPGRAANDAAARYSRQQFLPATVPLCVVFFVFYSCVALLQTTVPWLRGCVANC